MRRCPNVFNSAIEHALNHKDIAGIKEIPGSEKTHFDERGPSPGNLLLK